MPHKSFSLEFAGYYREPNAGSLPSASGVYCVYACTYDPRDQTVSLRELMYIGESGDIRDRVANHDKHDAWKRRLRAGETLCFSAAAVSSSDRTRVEAALIFEHQPPVNIEYKSRFPFASTTVSTSGRNAKLKSIFFVAGQARRAA